jgi:hypothetical protein
MTHKKILGPLKTIRIDSVRDVLSAAIYEECGEPATYESIRGHVGRTPNKLRDYIELLSRLKYLKVDGKSIVTTESGISYLRDKPRI